MSDDGESRPTILSSSPSPRTPEGMAWLGAASLSFIVCATAVETLKLSPEWSFVVGVGFVFAIEPLREWFAAHSVERSEVSADQ